MAQYTKDSFLVFQYAWGYLLQVSSSWAVWRLIAVFRVQKDFDFIPQLSFWMYLFWACDPTGTHVLSL